MRVQALHAARGRCPHVAMRVRPSTAVPSPLARRLDRRCPAPHDGQPQTLAAPAMPHAASPSTQLVHDPSPAPPMPLPMPPPPPVDARISVKLSLAAGSGRLDLTECGLTSLPPELFDLTDLEELSLAGNQLTSLPASLGNLTSLRRLQLAGNQLTSLPPTLGSLTQLEGLWLGGNLLESLPAELGRLSALRQLSLSGNRLTSLPDSLGRLSALQELEAAGNLLEAIPQGLYRLSALRKLSLHGNRLRSLPDGIGALASLQELWLMGNRLDSLPEGLDQLTALRKLSIADNAIRQLPSSFRGLPALEKLWAYGNRLQGPEALGGLPCGLGHAGTSATNGSGAALGGAGPAASAAVTAWPALDSIWLEGNPELGTQAAECLVGLAARPRSAGGLPRLKALGLDLAQLAGVAPATIRAAGACLKAGEVLGRGPGYFKLAPSPAEFTVAGAPETAPVGGKPRGPPPVPGSAAALAAKAAAAEAAEAAEAAAGEAAVEAVQHGRLPQQPVLVVAFGSAPGIPNWGGLLRRMYGEARDASGRAFDVLYVVDPARGWYEGGTHEEGEAQHRQPQQQPQQGQQRQQEHSSGRSDGSSDAAPDVGSDASSSLSYFASRLRRYTERYAHVVMLGDSMGATAALLFSGQATAVLAFCPQVDLASSSIRPGQPTDWLDTLRERVVGAVAATGAEVTALSGTWQHDLDQTKLLPDKTKHKVYSLDSHRLAMYLDKQDKLLPLVRDAVQHQLNQRTGNVRVANLL